MPKAIFLWMAIIQTSVLKALAGVERGCRRRFLGAFASLSQWQDRENEGLSFSVSTQQPN